ncbi:uncharacterized protein LOC122567163 [Bombus pyrosoma]|uniref:uncharacterized protein LOC122567163 n=1 Tax=Bombus pyrosoma TaxID=396416 RepID=UPI001CB92EA1|nr:uncharacterized protein LOC122567163 [Bombus pyrosoma]
MPPFRRHITASTSPSSLRMFQQWLRSQERIFHNLYFHHWIFNGSCLMFVFLATFAGIARYRWRNASVPLLLTFSLASVERAVCTIVVLRSKHLERFEGSKNCEENTCRHVK